MTYRGRVRNGVVVLDDPKALPDGAEVTVRALPAKTRGSVASARKPAVGRALLPLGGASQGAASGRVAQFGPLPLRPPRTMRTLFVESVQFSEDLLTVRLDDGRAYPSLLPGTRGSWTEPSPRERTTN